MADTIREIHDRIKHPATHDDWVLRLIYIQWLMRRDIYRHGMVFHWGLVDLFQNAVKSLGYIGDIGA